MVTATLTSQDTSSTPANKQSTAANKSTKPLRRAATDDEILGLGQTSEANAPHEQLELIWETQDPGSTGEPGRNGDSQSQRGSELQAVLDANPELQNAWDDAAAYRKTFATPEEAKTASTKLADLDRLDAMFFSRRPEDHAELARAVAALDPASFNSLAAAMAQLVSTRRIKDAEIHRGEASEANGKTAGAERSSQQTQPRSDSNAEPIASPTGESTQQVMSPSDNRGLSAAQTQFFHSANAAAVEEVVHAIENQVERLLPEEISRSARNRVVGEIYRELDTTLRSNRQLAQQMRDAFRSGALDADHQRAIVSLLAGRARQALPAVAKRVLNEWTSTIVAANQDRRARQRTAERRVDITGSGRTGNDGRRATSPRDIDYARMSDSDILNL